MQHLPKPRKMRVTLTVDTGCTAICNNGPQKQVKPWPNNCNISRLATLLQNVVTCCVLLVQV